MAIELVDGKIQLSGNETYTVEDIVTAISDTSVINGFGNKMYLISSDLLVGYIDGEVDENGDAVVTRLISNGDVVKLVGTNDVPINVVIGKDCVIKIGEIHYDGTTDNGSSWTGTNVDSIGGSGDMYCYGSTIEMKCEWKFANSVYQKIEVVNSVIDGYGSFRGASSRLENVVVTGTQGEYGSILPIGRMNRAKNVRFGMNDRLGYKVAIRFDRSASDDVLEVKSVYDGCVFGDSEYLISTDGGDKKLVLVDCEFANDSVVLDEGTDAETVDIEFRHTFNPTLVRIDGSPIVGATCILINSETGVSTSLVSDSNGVVKAELVYALFIVDKMSYINEYKMICISDGIKMTRIVNLTGPINETIYVTDDRLDEDRYELEFVVDRLNKIQPAVDRLEDGVMQTIANTATGSNFVIETINDIEVVI